MKVLIINPPAPFLAFPDAGPNMGLAYLSSFLKSYGIEVKYQDYATADPDEVILPEGYDYYLFSATTPEYHFANRLRKQANERGLGRTVIGGAHASVLPQECLKDGFDFVVTGYGEKAALKIVRGEILPGIVIGKPIENIGRLPFPDEEILHGGFDVAYGRKNRTWQILTMRGCPYGCHYCCSKAIYGHEAFFRSVPSVRKEIEHLVENFQITHLYFYDSCFSLMRKRSVEIARALKEFEINWSFQTRANLLDLRSLEEYKRCGCDQISIGIESGSKVIKTLGKRMTVERNSRAIKMCQDAGIRVKAFLMGALPDDTLRTTEDFKEFLLRNRPDSWLYSTFVPFPGTAYWSNPERFGLTIHTRDPRLCYPLGLNGRGPVNTSTAYLSRDELYESRDHMLAFLRQNFPNPRVERAIELFPQQRALFDRAMGDYVY